MVFTIVRLWYLAHFSSTDGTYNDALPTLWTVLELSIACMCACLPGLMPIFTKYLFKKRGGLPRPQKPVIFSGEDDFSVMTTVCHPETTSTRQSDEKRLLSSRPSLLRSFSSYAMDSTRGGMSMNTGTTLVDRDVTEEDDEMEVQIGSIRVNRVIEQCYEYREGP